MSKGYRGFTSKEAYEAHYSDERNYADEIPAMKAYSREAEAEHAGEEVMDSEPPILLVHRIEAALEGETPDRIIFSMGLVLGHVIALFSLPEDHAEVLEACENAIRVGIRESEVELKDRH